MNYFINPYTLLLFALTILFLVFKKPLIKLMDKIRKVDNKKIIQLETPLKIELKDDELFINDIKHVFVKRSLKIYELKNADNNYIISDKETLDALAANSQCIPERYRKPEGEEVYLIFIEAQDNEKTGCLHWRTEPYPGLWRKKYINFQYQLKSIAA